MFCPKCGKQLPPDGICPDCNTVEAVPVKKDNKFKIGPSDGARGYAAIFTALLVFPTSLCIAIDLSFHTYDFWFGYIIGAPTATYPNFFFKREFFGCVVYF